MTLYIKQTYNAQRWYIVHKTNEHGVQYLYSDGTLHGTCFITDDDHGYYKTEDEARGVLDAYEHSK